MAILVLAMLLVVGFAVAIVGLVAVPAHRDGREVLTARGEGVLDAARDRVSTLGRHSANTP